MPIGAATRDKPEMLDEGVELSDLVRRMSGMPHLETIEAGFHQRLHPAPVSIGAWMRQKRETPRAMDQRDCVGDADAVLGHKRRTIGTEVAIESVAKIHGPPVCNQHSRDVRPTDRTTGCLVEHGVERDRNAEPVQRFDDALGAGAACGAEHRQLSLELFESGEVQAQHVHFAVAFDGTELHARNDSDSESFTCLTSLGDAGERIVIGERDRLETGSLCRLDDAGRRYGAVGRRRVHMQIDVVAHWRRGPGGSAY